MRQRSDGRGGEHGRAKEPIQRACVCVCWPRDWPRRLLAGNHREIAAERPQNIREGEQRVSGQVGTRGRGRGYRYPSAGIAFKEKFTQDGGDVIV